MEYARTIQLDELPSMAFSTQEPQFQVVLIYEDFEMGILGQNVFDQITKEVGGESAARLTVWGFDFFHTPELTHAVSRQAVAADVIIVAPRDPNQLPPQVRDWLEGWPPRRSLQGGVLIAIFDPNLPHSHAKSCQSGLLLWRAACRAQMDFICRSGTPKRPAASIATTTTAPRNPSSNPATITQKFREFHTGWGLNE